ncbi:MAG TPA: ADOP family duplicated permease, partial [Vicinamibacteria bacterium]|nr:ADOP family duplicated permease [Vicinamibacteria bacterium]
VVGVMSKEFSFPPGSEIHLWTPLSFDPGDAHGRSRRARSLNVVGRLRDDATRQSAQEEMDSIASALADEFPDTLRGYGATVEAVYEQLVAAARPALLLLFATVLFLLLIACANVASLMLARLETRRREIALRSALGAARATIVRQVLVESLVLSVSGGALGIVAALLGVGMTRNLALSGVPRLAEVGIDGGVLAFTALVSILVALAFGVLPALHASRADLVPCLNEGGRTGSAGTGKVLGSIAGLEVALAVALLAGAGLSLRSFHEMMRVDPGFRPDALLAAQIYLPQARYGDEENRLRFFTEALARLRALPGVRSAGAASALPMHPVGIDFALPFSIEGRNPPASGEEPRADVRAVTEGYFETMKIPLVQGRLFDEGDRRDAPHRILINATLARRYFPGEEPMGKVIVNPHGKAEIVGVVADVHHYGLDAEPRPELYTPLQQGVFNGMTLVVRTTVAPESFAAELRRTIRQIDSEQAIYDLSTMEQAMARWVFLPRLSMTLLGLFAASALALAGLGIYGVIAYSVSQRSMEMGLRMALGAGGADLVKLVMGGSLRFVLPGMAAGLILAAVMAKFLSGQLFGVSPFDPVVYLSVGLLLLLTAAAAGYLPARRAMRVDPIEALRSE